MHESESKANKAISTSVEEVIDKHERICITISGNERTRVLIKYDKQKYNDAV
jgi:hypothetical protein